MIRLDVVWEELLFLEPLFIVSITTDTSVIILLFNLHAEMLPHLSHKTLGVVYQPAALVQMENRILSQFQGELLFFYIYVICYKLTCVL